MRLHRLLLVPALLSALAVLLVWRIDSMSTYDSHRFLIWNLTLAWIPLVAALALYLLRRRRALLVVPLGLLWLLFLPNAPYLVTDLIHYGDLNSQIPRWLDLAALLAAAGAGASLGLLSLRYAHLGLEAHLGRWSWLPLSAAIVATSFGVYVGRVLRLNSWDVAHPRHTLSLLLPRLSSPGEHPLMVAGVLAVALALALCYAALCALIREGRPGQS